MVFLSSPSSLCVTSSRWPLGLPNAMMKGMRTHTAAAEAEAGRPHNAGRPLTQPSGPLTVAGAGGRERGRASWAYGCVTAREVKRERGWGERERGSGAYDACTACPQCIAGRDGRTEAGEKGERTYDPWANPSAAAAYLEVGTFIPPRTHPLFAHSC